MPPSKHTPEQRTEMAELYRSGLSIPKIAKRFGTNDGVVRSAVVWSGQTPRERRKVITPEFVGAVVRDYQAGMTAPAIAEQHSCTYPTVLRALEMAGVERRNPSLNQAMWADADCIRADYEAGMTLEGIRDKYGHPPTSVAEMLKKVGVKVRKNSDYRRYALDVSPFEADELCPAAAYYVGLLLTDGCVVFQDGAYRVRLVLTLGDRHILEELKEFLKFDGPIREYPAKPCSINPNSKSRPTAALVVCSERFANALAKWGVVSRKTPTAAAHPSLALNPHFWRGVIDGDGTVVEYEGGPGVALSVASRALVDGFVAFCRSVCPESKKTVCIRNPQRDGYLAIHRINYTHTQAFRILKSLYGVPGPRLRRKHKRAVKLCNAVLRMRDERSQLWCVVCGGKKRVQNRMCFRCSAESKSKSNPTSATS